jgi:hypothetical protein
MGRNDVGTVKRGNLADVVLLEASPLENTRNTTRIAAVVANGHLYDRAVLDRLLADAEESPPLPVRVKVCEHCGV